MPPTPSSETLPNHHEAILTAAPGIEQRAYALVERGETGLPMHCQPQQIGVRYLLVAHDVALEVPDGIRKRQIVRPEPMHWVADVQGKKSNRCR